MCVTICTIYRYVCVCIAATVNLLFAAITVRSSCIYIDTYVSIYRDIDIIYACRYMYNVYVRVCSGDGPPALRGRRRAHR